jgi:hypothetical protein
VKPEQVTTDELRAAFSRAALLHLRGWTFARAMAVPLVAWSMEKSALAHRQTHHYPAQPRLI